MKKRIASGRIASKSTQKNLGKRAKTARARWLDKNAEAIREYNERVANKGTFSDRLRRW